MISLISLANLVVLLRMVGKLKTSKTGGAADFDLQMRLLAVPYVVMTAWRSFFPNEYADRVCLFDNWMSSALVARSLATVGEVCFVTQIGMAIRRANFELVQLQGRQKSQHNYLVDLSAYLLTFTCTIAQGFCITTTMT